MLLMKQSNIAPPLTSPNGPLGRDELEARLHCVLGRFFVTFARMELNLSLRVGGNGSFKEKLERLFSSSREFGGSDDTFCEVAAWYMAADSMRETRNLLAHGRWGYHVLSQQVVHVSGYPPDPQPERRFSLSELDQIVGDAELLNNELMRLSDC